MRERALVRCAECGVRSADRLEFEMLTISLHQIGLHHLFHELLRDAKRSGSGASVKGRRQRARSEKSAMTCAAQQRRMRCIAVCIAVCIAIGRRP
jgi:hypothetical protein